MSASKFDVDDVPRRDIQTSGLGAEPPPILDAARMRCGFPLRAVFFEELAVLPKLVDVRHLVRRCFLELLDAGVGAKVNNRVTKLVYRFAPHGNTGSVTVGKGRRDVTGVRHHPDRLGHFLAELGCNPAHADGSRVALVPWNLRGWND